MHDEEHEGVGVTVGVDSEGTDAAGDQGDHQEEEDRARPLDPEEALQSEDDLLKALIEAGGEELDVKENTRVCRARLKNGRIVHIRVRGLDENEEEACRRKAREETKRQKRKGGRRGVIRELMPEVDMAIFRSHMLIAATVAFCIPLGDPDEEGRQAYKDVESMWDNADLRKKLDARSKAQLVDKVLPSGQKMGIISIIEQLSGYEDEVEEEAGN